MNRDCLQESLGMRPPFPSFPPVQSSSCSVDHRSLGRRRRFPFRCTLRRKMDLIKCLQSSVRVAVTADVLRDVTWLIICPTLHGACVGHCDPYLAVQRLPGRHRHGPLGRTLDRFHSPSLRRRAANFDSPGSSTWMADAQKIAAFLKKTRWLGAIGILLALATSLIVVFLAWVFSQRWRMV